jgi:hypothetical protein
MISANQITAQLPQPPKVPIINPTTGQLDTWWLNWFFHSFNAIQRAVSALSDTLANFNNTNYPASNFTAGQQFFISTWAVTYVVESIASVNTWVYSSGTYVAPTADRPTTGFNGAALGTNDTGLQFLDTTLNLYEQWTGAAWINIPQVPDSADLLGTNASGQIIQATLGAGDIFVGSSSNLPAPVTVTGDITLSDTGLTVVIRVNGGSIPASAVLTATNSSGQFIAAALPSGQIYIGSVGNLPVGQTMSGDATIADNGVVTLKNTGPGAGTYTVGAKLTPTGTNGTVTLDNEGRVTAIQQAT